MSLINKIILLGLQFLIVIFHSYSQEPYHIIIGEAELSSTKIYDILKGKDGKLYLATNEGLKLFDGYNIISYTNKKSITSSIFNLCEDKFGNIYYNNLNGQIFSFDGNEIKLVHQIEKIDLSPYISYILLEDSQIIVHAASLYMYDIKKDSKKYYYPPCVHNSLSSLTQIGDSVMINFWKDSLTFIIGDKVTNKYIKTNDKNITESRTYDFSEFKKIRILSNLGKGIYTYKNNEKELQIKDFYPGPSELTRLYITSKHIWYASNKSGVYVSNQINNYTFDKVLESYFISCVFEDENGTVYFGTFNNGIIILPNKNGSIIPDINNEKITNITVNSSGTIFLGTNQGKIYQFNDSKLLINTNYKEIELLEFFEFCNEKILFYDSLYPKVYNLSTHKITNINGGGSIKGLNKSVNQFYIASNINTYIYDYKLDSIAILYNGRSRSVIKFENNILIGANNGLFLKNQDTLIELTFDGNSVFANSMVSKDGQVYISTSKFGILKYSNHKLKSFVKQKKIIMLFMKYIFIKIKLLPIVLTR